MKVRARSKSTSGRVGSFGCVWMSPYTVLATADVAVCAQQHLQKQHWRSVAFTQASKETFTLSEGPGTVYQHPQSLRVKVQLRG